MAKVRIPKRVGGVKIPKKLRRKAKNALKAVENPAVQEFAAAALGAAARSRASRPGPRAAGAVARPTMRLDGDRLAETIRAAALDGLRRFMEGFEEGLREAEGRSASPPPASAAP